MSFYVRSSTYILLHRASPTTSISPRCSPAVVSSPDCASDVCCAWGPCILKGEPPLEQHGQMGHGAWCWGDTWYFWLGQGAKSKWSPDGCASGLFMSVSPGKKGRPAEWRTPGPWRTADHFLTKHVNFSESSKSRFRPIAIWLKKKPKVCWNGMIGQFTVFPVHPASLSPVAPCVERPWRQIFKLVPFSFSNEPRWCQHSRSSIHAQEMFVIILEGDLAPLCACNGGQVDSMEKFVGAAN